MLTPGRAERAVLAFLEDGVEDLAETLVALVRTATVSPYSGDPDARGELEGQRYFERLLRAAGGRTELLEIPADVYERGRVLGPAGRDFRGRPCLLGRFRFGGGTGPKLIFNAHMDTVGASDFEGEPFSGRREGDLVHGRGASDCKGGLVAGLFALRALAETNAPVDGEILFESVVEEECSGAGAGTLACCLAGVQAHAAIVLDGGAGRLLTGCQGIVTLEASVRGRAGHGSYGGVSAVDKLLAVKAAVDRLAAERAATHPAAAVNVGVLRAGLAPWVVPNRGYLSANVNYDYTEAVESERAGKGFCGALVRERFEQLLAEAAAADEWLREHRPELVWTKDAPPYRLADCRPEPAAAELLAAARRGGELGWGRAPEEGELPAWFDGSHLARVGGMPVVGMGAGEPGAAHSATEFNRVSNVKGAAAAAALTALALLGK
jgi:acetylornithine deacetylase